MIELFARALVLLALAFVWPGWTRGIGLIEKFEPERMAKLDTCVFQFMILVCASALVLNPAALFLLQAGLGLYLLYLCGERDALRGWEKVIKT